MILVSSLALAAGGCFTIERTGEYYVATKTFVGKTRYNRDVYPSFGIYFAMAGIECPFPLLPLVPVGFVVFGAEAFVFAPVWDTLCLPCDYFCYREKGAEASGIS